MVADGPGPRRAAHALDVALSKVSPAAIVSTGVCGGLAEGLKVGTILIANRILDGDGGGEYAAATPQSAPAASTVTIVSMDRVAVTLSDKRKLRGTGAAAVEMEAAAVAARASKERTPFFCVRAVSDTAEEEFALDFNLLRDRDGRFNLPAIVWEALKRPLQRIPSLLRLDRNSRAAAESLGDFLATCRF